MNKANLVVVRDFLGRRAVVLEDLFRNATGTPPGVAVDRYRADHPQWLDLLDYLEANQIFLNRNRDSNHYRVRMYALPILKDRRAKQLLDLMDRLYKILRSIYRERLTTPIAIEELLEIARRNKILNEASLIKDALHYMVDGHSIWSGYSLEFPYGPGSQLSVSESVLRLESFDSVINQVYEWHIVNPKRLANAPLSGSAGQIRSKISRKRTKQVVRTAATGFRMQGKTVSPEWYQKLDSSQKALLIELDKAVRGGMVALPTMGLRTLIEVVMLAHIPDKGNFRANLTAFLNAGYITRQQSELIAGVINAGNAAVHRAYFPNLSDLQTCVDAVRHLLEGVYILKPRIEAVTSNTPKRKRST